MGRVATEKKNPLRAAKRRHCSHAIEQGAALTRRYSRLLASWVCKAHHCTTTSPQGAIRLRPRQAAGDNPPRQRTVTMPFCSARCIHKTDHTRGQFDPRENSAVVHSPTHSLTHTTTRSQRQSCNATCATSGMPLHDTRTVAAAKAAAVERRACRCPGSYLCPPAARGHNRGRSGSDACPTPPEMQCGLHGPRRARATRQRSGVHCGHGAIVDHDEGLRG